MCDCEEIQKLWKPKEGDFVSHKERYDPGVLLIIDELVKKLIFLPRQDQLQKMVDFKLYQLNFAFSEWYYDIDETGDCDFHVKHEHCHFETMEQLWLAFVMFELHQKQWSSNERKWVNI